MTLREVLNVCYVLILDEQLAMVRSERQAAAMAQVFSNKPIERPDPAEAVRMLDASLEEPLPDLASTDLRQALGLDER